MSDKPNFAHWVRDHAITADTLDPRVPLDHLEPLRAQRRCRQGGAGNFVALEQVEVETEMGCREITHRTDFDVSTR